MVTCYEPCMRSDGMMTQDTIVAQATAHGEGAVAVLRISGEQARRIAAVLAPASRQRQSHRLGRVPLLAGDGAVLDDAMLVEMHAPHSYTGEDVVELHVHGARPVVQAVLERCCALGARLAGPGEFTFRAFLNGRMDLAQAEAVGSLIAAQSEAERQQSTQQLLGGLSKRIAQLLRKLENVLIALQAAIDFPDFPTGEGWEAGHLHTLQHVREQVQALIDGARVMVHQRSKVVLCGPPNAGKSTLLNAWAGEERVLVDDAAGTTRDPVEVELSTGMAQFVVCDTAGIHRAQTTLEARGVAMSMQWMHRADIALWLVPGDTPAWPPEGAPVRFVVGSKADITDQTTQQATEVEAARRGLVFLGWIATPTGTGVTDLQVALQAQLTAACAGGPGSAPQVTRQRHLEALQQAELHLRAACDAARDGATIDVITFEIEDAARFVGHVIGRDVDAAVLDGIFSQFCIGK